MGDVIRAAVKHVLVIDGKVVPQLHGIVVFDRQQQHAALDQGKEVWGAGCERILHGIFVERFDAYGLVKARNHFVAHKVGLHFGVVDVVQIPVIVVQAFDEVAHHAQGIRVVLRVANVADTVHEVLRSHRKAGVLALMVHPVHALADLEGPDGLIRIGLPAFRNGRDVYAVDIRLHKAVDAV